MWDKWLSEVVAGTQDNPRQLEVLKRLRCIKDTLLVIVESDAVESYGIGYTSFQHTVRALVLVSRRKFASLGFRCARDCPLTASDESEKTHYLLSLNVSCVHFISLCVGNGLLCAHPEFTNSASRFYKTIVISDHCKQ